jgi:subfamily B ATP-binding cassette protein MsbA
MMIADFLLDTRSDEQAHPGRTVSVVSRLELDGVEFGYGDGPSVIDALSLSFERGTVTAIVGTSGSGKTTVLELLAGFRMPRRGHLLVDGADLTELDLDSYRRRIGYASQEAILFHGGALENVRFLRPHASDADVERAIALACAEEFLGRDERDVGEHGRKLSGGQRQRVALARVFLQHPDVLLLDEATNALDLATEARLYENLLRLRDEGKIVAVVAHRLSALTSFDRIVVLHEGQPAEVGSHDELMAAGGIYYHLFSLQQLEPERPPEELDER